MEKGYKNSKIFTDELKRTFPIYIIRHDISSNGILHIIYNTKHSRKYLRHSNAR